MFMIVIIAIDIAVLWSGLLHHHCWTNISSVNSRCRELYRVCVIWSHGTWCNSKQNEIAWSLLMQNLIDLCLIICPDNTGIWIILHW